MSTYTPIATQTLGSAAASVTFSSIPQGYTDLVLVINSVAASSTNNMDISFNSDTGANYSRTRLTGDGSGTSSARASSQTSIRLTGDGIVTTGRSNHLIQLMNYSNATTFKTVLARANNTAYGLDAVVGLYRSTSAITSFVLTLTASDFGSGSTFSLYGIAGGQYTAKASGGIVTTSGGYAYHTFLTSGGFIPSQDLTVDYLVVAGGGGGSAGGGGAGGLRSTVTASGGSPGTVETALSLKAGITYPAIVGAGGAGGISYSAGQVRGGTGGNSVFSTIASLGGGGGGSGADQNQTSPLAVLSGGSGGGATYSSGQGNYGAGTTGQGFNGGADIFDDPPYPGAGGGGAGQVGQNPPNGSAAGNGGNGVQITALATPTSTGANSGYYAGGGGGGIYGAASTATGGLGGGGNGGTSTNAVTNTGGGGGGVANAAQGGNGGSGIVIIRYAL